jgi:ABC-2 type transport system ATP-binding protein
MCAGGMFAGPAGRSGGGSEWRPSSPRSTSPCPAGRISCCSRGCSVPRPNRQEAADRRVRTCSGGTRRRIDLAASLLGRPQVLFLDEPSTGLDPVACRQLWGMVRNLAYEGLTVVLTTQYLPEAEQLADEVVVLAGGRVVAGGRPDELKRRIGSRVLTLTFPDRWRGEYAARALHRVGVVGMLDSGAVTLTIPVRGGRDVLSVVRTASALELPVADVRVKEPTLEDVYLSLHQVGQAR